MPLILCTQSPGGKDTEINTASGSIANFETNISVPLNTAVFNFTPTQAQGTPTPSNPITIYGHTGLNVVKCGKNLFDITKLETTNITVVNGEATGTGTAFNTAYGSNISFLKFSSGQMTLTISAYTDGNSSTSGNGLRVRFYYTDGTNSAITFLNSDTTLTTKTMTSTSGKVIERMTISFVSTGSNIWHISDVQLECGTSSTTFEAYTAATYPISWSDTVYGGFVNEKGEVWATRGVLDLSEVEWTLSSNRARTTELASLMKLPPNNDTPSTAIAEKYTAIAWSGSLNTNQTSFAVASDGTLVFYYDGNTTPTGSFVYGLATPVKIATIDQIVINSALGVNNVWNDGGGDTSVTYHKQTKFDCGVQVLSGIYCNKGG